MQQLYLGGQPAAPAPGHANGEANQDPSQISSSVDELIAGAAKAPEAAEKEKPSKKDKSKPTRMIYSDDTISPEEKMAQLPRYAFKRDRFTDHTALGEVPGGVVVGAIRDSDTVIDPAH